MKRTLIRTTCIALAFLAVAPRVGAEDSSWHCYITTGGTYCAEDGTFLAFQYEQLARDYAALMGWQYAPLPGVAPTTTTQPPVAPEMECFVLVGGNYCYPKGSAEAETARKLAEEYADTLGTLPSPMTTVPVAEEDTVPDETSAPVEPEVTVTSEAPIESESTVTSETAPVPRPSSDRSRPTLPETS